MERAVDRENEWLSIQEAAEELGVNPRTVRRYIRLERLPVSRISNKVVRIRLADLDRLMEANVVERSVSEAALESAAEPGEAARSRPTRAAPAHFSTHQPGSFRS